MKSSDSSDPDNEGSSPVAVAASKDEVAPQPKRRARVRRATRPLSNADGSNADGSNGEAEVRPARDYGHRSSPEDQDLPALTARPVTHSPRDRRPPSDPPPLPAHHEPIPPRYAVKLDASRIDPDVDKVVRRLVRHGYEAYLVGGCVRDLLLDGTPKDFDVATSARPEQVRQLFRNSRVIGRRFRLVHVLFHGNKVIEVATFRRNPNDDAVLASSEDMDGAPPASADNAQLLIRSDNVFGEAHEDAERRDFTINALFYDVEAGQMLDWVGGLADVQRRVVNTIGEPHLRFREDPIRMLRALKFAGRLDLGIQPEVYDAIVECRSSLELAARPRVAEEVLRLMRGGGARRTLFLAWETGILDVLLPELAALLYDSFNQDDPRSAGHRVFRLLEFVDRRTREQGPRDDVVLWTILLLEPLKEAAEGERNRSVAVTEFLDPLLDKLAISKRFADGMRKIVEVLPKILSGKAGRLARMELFEPALEVAEADLYARGLPTDSITALRSAARAEGSLGREPRAHPPTHRPGSAHVRPRPTPRH